MLDTGFFPTDAKFVSPEIYDAFFAVIERLEATIETETAMLRTHELANLPALTRQKRQGMLELERIMQSLRTMIPSQDIIARLGRFRRAAAMNETALRVTLDAAQEVTAIIVKVMREMDSDGTYSRAYGRADYDFA